MSDSYRVLVTGSRDWKNRTLINLVLDGAFVEAANARRIVTLVEGACPTGADDMAYAWALWMRSRDLPVRFERHPARNHPTEDFGPWPYCGPRRNQHMVNLGADVCQAFIGPCTSPRCRIPGVHPSHGATGCALLAEQAGIPVRRYYA